MSQINKEQILKEISWLANKTDVSTNSKPKLSTKMLVDVETTDFVTFIEKIEEMYNIKLHNNYEEFEKLLFLQTFDDLCSLILTKRTEQIQKTGRAYYKEVQYANEGMQINTESAFYKGKYPVFFGRIKQIFTKIK